MFDLQHELNQLIDTYPLQDELTKLSLSQKLEEAFFARLTVKILEQSDPQLQELLINEPMDPEQWFAHLYEQVDDIDPILIDTFNEIKKEFTDDR